MICNDFQVLAKAGILPKSHAGRPELRTLAGSDSNKSECRWIHLLANEAPAFSCGE